MHTDFDAVINEQLNKAQATGMSEPVFASLLPQVAQARAIYFEATGHSLETPSGKEVMTVLLPLSITDAARLFRRHAGQGGAVAADMLEDGILADYWLALLMPDALHLAAFRAGEKIRSASLGYTKVSRHIRSLTNLLNDDSASLLTLKTDDGQDLTVCGGTGGATALAAALASMVLTRQLPVPHEGRIVKVPVDEKRLSSFLLNAFSDPKIVAEAIMALKKMNGNKDRWLRKVLRRPELRALAERVRHELTGE